MENFKIGSIKTILYDPDAFPINSGMKANDSLTYTASFEAEVVSSQALPSISTPDSQGNRRQLFSSRHILDIRIRDRFRAGLGATPGYDFPFNLSVFAIVTERNQAGIPTFWQFYTITSLVELEDNQLLLTIESDTEAFSRYSQSMIIPPLVVNPVSDNVFFIGTSFIVPEKVGDLYNAPGPKQAEFNQFIETIADVSMGGSYTFNRNALILENGFVDCRCEVYLGFPINDQGVINLPSKIGLQDQTGWPPIAMTATDIANRTITARYNSAQPHRYQGRVALVYVNHDAAFDSQTMTLTVSF